MQSSKGIERKERVKKIRWRADGGVYEDFDGWSDSCVPGECLWRTRGSLEINALIADEGGKWKKNNDDEGEEKQIVFVDSEYLQLRQMKGSQLWCQRL